MSDVSRMNTSERNNQTKVIIMAWSKTTSTTTKHSHKANFGRHVEGCARCEEIKAGAPVVKWNIAPKQVEYKHVCSAKCGVVCTYGEW